jgi:imidazolonepropionase-like amidohydrolase
MAIIFRNSRIITGTGEVIEKGAVVADGSTIQSIGADRRISASKKGQVYDLAGKTILPGFIDCHVHLCMDASLDPVAALLKESVAQTALKAASHARSTLSAGVTTIRDMGGRDYVDLAVRNAIQSNLIEGPRMVCSGRLICMTGGHGWQVGREADGVDGVRQAVREQVKAGVNVIKMMATGGILARGSDSSITQLTLEELAAGVEEARKAGKKTASHAQGNEGIKNSLRAGIDSIEHGIFLDEEALQMMSETKAYLVPTLCAPYNILKAGVKKGIRPWVIEKAKVTMKNHLDSIRKAYKARIPIALGTDAGNPFNFHGENLGEMELLLKVGMSPMEAIVSATKIGSEVLGLQDKIGTLEKGKLADLVVVDGNPLEDIRILRQKEKIMDVMKEGKFYKWSF